MHDLNHHACASAFFLDVLSHHNQILCNTKRYFVFFFVSFSAVRLIAKLCQFTCSFKRHFILLFNLAMIGVYALDDLTSQICHAAAAQAVFVYWHHGMNEFQYFTMQDNDRYHQELRNLRNQRLSGVITCVRSGEPLVVSGHTFHVMEITFAGVQCAPCMLLRRDGNTDHLDVTPYLFKSINSLNAAITYINRL